MIAESIVRGSKKVDQTHLRRQLVKAFRHHQSDFRFLTFATGAYYFQRVRDFYDLDLREMVHIVYDFDKKQMHCSVSSRLNPIYLMNPMYGEGIINAHVDLIAIKRGYNIYPTENNVYRCDGTMEGAAEMVDEMLKDFTTAGVRYLDKRLEELWSNAVLRKGLDIIDAWDLDKTMLKNELIKHLRSAKNDPERLRHPLVNVFKDELLAVPNISSEMKKRVPILVFDLLELYCNGRITP